MSKISSQNRKGGGGLPFFGLFCFYFDFKLRQFIQTADMLFFLKEAQGCLFFFFFEPCPLACRVLVPQPGIESKPGVAVKVKSPNHWIAREFPIF